MYGACRFFPQVFLELWFCRIVLQDPIPLQSRRNYFLLLIARKTSPEPNLDYLHYFHYLNLDGPTFPPDPWHSPPWLLTPASSFSLHSPDSLLFSTSAFPPLLAFLWGVYARWWTFFLTFGPDFGTIDSSLNSAWGTWTAGPFGEIGVFPGISKPLTYLLLPSLSPPSPSPPPASAPAWYSPGACSSSNCFSSGPSWGSSPPSPTQSLGPRNRMPKHKYACLQQC